jgi:hypothetical protein
MKKSITINNKQNAYFPKDFIENGFTGEIDSYSDGVTVLLVKPGTSIDVIEKSIKNILWSIKLPADSEPQETAR